MKPANAGLVSLVGAGPGDPELLTLAAARRLAEADVVLYDALIPHSVLALARGARVSVGKRARRPSRRGRGAQRTQSPHPDATQDRINALLIRLARRGRRVVRLKGGDPFVLGRGGEEALALAAAGVPFEIVPGVSSAVAAPALAGIPVTHRGLASGFAVLTGQTAAEEATFDSVAPNALTLVVLMGLVRRREIARTLVARGWRPETPAAVLLAAGTPEEERWTGSLAGLAAGDGLEPGDRPGTLVVGEVVALSATLAPREPAVAHERRAHVGRR
jgi:uroporphyrin-III C-methyltransferase/precorrin-2 dehydrogenase/sirohydrochlorin ferrochelatase